MKKFLALLMTLVVSLTTLGGVACRGSTGSDDPQVLDIYVYVQGYGSTWLDGVIDKFEEQDWVKEKYPKLSIDVETNSIGSTAEDRLSTPKTNKTDLFFGQYGVADMSKAYLTNLTKEVYLTEIPGQPGTLIMDRLPEQVKNVLERPDDTDEDIEFNGETYKNYYAGKHLYQIYGWMYNRTLFDKYYPEEDGWKLPVTTHEWFKICEDIQTKGYEYTYDGKTEVCKTPVMISGIDGGYSESQVEMWWAQYEGFDGYEAFFNGTYGEEISNKVVQQVGRYRALQQIDKVSQNYSYEHALKSYASEAQSYFLQGQGLFHYNGDYFTTEMQLVRDQIRNNGANYDIATFACPVTSTLLEQLDFYKNKVGKRATPEFPYAPFTNQAKPFDEISKAEQDELDEVLATLIREIDEGKTYENCTKEINGYEISAKDFNKIVNARAIKGRAFLGNEAFVIPEKTPAKELACDFVRFMYTDIALEAFSVASKGLVMPATFFEEIGDTEYDRIVNQFETEAVNKFDMLFNRHKDYATPWQVLPQAKNYLFGKAGLETLKSYNGTMTKDFLSKEANRTKPNAIFVADVNYWSEKAWDQLYLDTLKYGQ